MEITKLFVELNKADAAIAGGKGASLGEMTQAGIPVPPGFVVLSGAFEQFLLETDVGVEVDAILATVKKDEMHTIEHASEKIQALILAAKMPKNIYSSILQNYKTLNSEFVAVRSSATAEDSASAAWAGQLDSFLNTNESTLLLHVQKCWASLFTPRAIFYRFEKELHLTNISVAVVVQKMVESEYSGIAFSVHPVTEDRNQLIIEAGFGLGEAIVSGAVTPDSYVMTKQPRLILDSNISTKKKALYRKNSGGNEWKELSEPNVSSQVLNKQQILELADIIIKIENHYGFPCDIEWAFEAGKFFIVQSRPITTLTNKPQINNETALSFKAVDYEFVFESNGTSFLFEDLCCSYYMPEDSLEIGVEKIIRTYESKKNIAHLQAFGESCSIETLKDAVTIFEATTRSIIERTEDFKNTERVTQGDAQYLFGQIKVLFEKYFLFDFLHWDTVFQKAKTDAVMQEKVHFVEEHKNILRAAFEPIMFIEDSYYKIFLQKLAYQTNVSVEDIEWYREVEIYSLFDGEKLSPEVIKSRKQAYALYKNKDIILYSGTEALELSKLFLGSISSSSVIIGKVAHVTGVNVTGKVRLIERDYANPQVLQDAIKSMQQGEILVSQSTDPELIEAMKKAVAIVTDAGGMLSHAAITARELHIPCLVGTTVATKILKTGDEVEIDFKSGVLTIVTKEWTPRSANYILTYEGRGLKPLFYNFVSEGYLPAVSVVLYRDDLCSQFYSKNQIQKMEEVGTQFFQEKNALEDVISRFEKLILKTDAISKKIAEVAILSQNDVQEAFQNMLDIHREYAHFDFPYTDGAFNASKNNSVIAKMLNVVEEKKNIFREDYNKIFFSSEGLFEIVVEKIAAQFSVPIGDLQWYLYKEIFGLFEKSRLSSEKIKNRKQAYVFYKRSEGDEFEFNEGETAIHKIELFGISDIETSDLHGVVANAGGVIQGEVFVLDTDYGDFEKLKQNMALMKQGQILVAPTTAPEHMDAIRKAAAIIVDVGGMLSHTAIVSRELKIPSIVGTQHGSKLLHTGDMVEVDASKGIVRILQKHA